MLKTIVGIFASILLCTSFAAADLAAPGSKISLEQNGKLMGSVYEAGAGVVANTDVAILDTGFDIIAELVTDQNGKFEITLAEGDYFVRAGSGDFIQRFHPNEYMLDDAKPVHIISGRVTNIIFELEQGSQISGTINSEIQANVDFVVSAVKFDNPYHRWQSDQSFSISGNGTYTLRGLIPGYYKVFVRADDCQTQFFDHVDDFKSASPVLSELDDPATGIDFDIIAPGNGFVSGNVSTISGIGVDNVLILGYTWNNEGDSPFDYQTTTNSNGDFSLEVTAGHYYIEAVVPPNFSSGLPIHLFYQYRYDPKLADVVDVEPGGSVEDIEFTFDPNKSYNLVVSGGVYDNEHHHPVNDVRLTAIDYYDGTPIAYTYSNEAGQFNIQNMITGDYLIELAGGGLVPAFWNNVFRWQEAEIIQLGNTGSILHNGGAITQDYGVPGFSISGKVVDENDYPIENARIYAFNNDTGNITFAMTDALGMYDIASGLSSGSYTVFVDMYGFNTQDYPEQIELDLINNPIVTDVDFILEPFVLSIGIDSELPDEVLLLGNFPNPFNNSTTIMFSSDRSYEGRLEVFNIVGQQVTTIDIRIEAGLNHVVWDGTSNQGTTVASGVFFYKLSDSYQTRKMLLLK